MRILITGGAGFIGDRLARALLRVGGLELAGGRARRVTEVVLLDRVQARADLIADGRVRSIVGDASGQLSDALEGIDLVFHLAAVVSSEAERDFDLGMRVNLETTLELLEASRRQSRPPRLVFASSLAVYGNAPGRRLPDVVADDTLPTPQSSYGTQKFIGEQLVADFARRGLVPARSVRLMTVTVRPGLPNAAASSFLSGIVREPLAGKTSNSPVGRESLVAVTSPARTIEGLLRAATATDQEWGDHTAVTLPALTVSVGGIVDALERVAGAHVARRVTWIPDRAIADIVMSWPARFAATRAKMLGLAADPDFESIIRQYQEDIK